MGLDNKQKDMTPYDMSRKPVKQFPPLLLLLWGAALVSTPGLKKNKIRMEGLKPPFLVYSTHQGFSDYFIVPRMLFPHRANYVSDMEGFAAFGNAAYRAGGCIGKRRYVPDVSVMLNIRYALRQLKQTVVLFPESRHCDAGITSTLPDNLGKLAKFLDVPLVVIYSHGCYLANPFWDEERSRKVRMESTAELLYTREELRKASADEVQRLVEEKLQYDEYAWQKENGIKIDYAERAEGLHLPLYQCRSCGTKGKMRSRGADLWCDDCKKRWSLTADGDLADSDTGELYSISEWYRQERGQVEKEIEDGTYRELDIPVKVEALPNEKGFVPMGSGRLVYNSEGFYLYLEDQYAKKEDYTPLFFSNRKQESLQTEYNYKKRGKCIVLSTKNCCYYVYSEDENFIVTELEFAVEKYHSLSVRNDRDGKKKLQDTVKDYLATKQSVSDL